ncbi:G5 domain-containing protein [Microbacterium sp. B35-04]|uniref:G5 domain-containing protein n=1 Tax=Microbacterium sp. B35-04 TaxID=1961716 RepID=UPI0013D66B53|nr:G5 domain-containing protein [Microbacterium sp. B35-04]
MTTQPPGWYPDPVNATRQRWWDGGAWSPHVASNGTSWVEPIPATPTPPAQRGSRRMPVWVWVLIGAVALIPVILLSPVVAVIALIVLITGIVALAKGTRTWLRLSSRKTAIAVTAAAAAVLVVTGSVSAAVLPNTGRSSNVEAAHFAGESSSKEARSDESRSTPTPTPTPTPVTSTRDEVVTEAIPFTETWVDDGALPAGQTQVRTPGQNGEKALTYRVHLLDGQEVSRELVSDVVTTQPTTQVVANGTYVAPPPPPPPAPAQPAGNCDSNYAEACVPIDSDVDCAGGSGNGPSYFNGIARVVGSDIYDLDRDGDGFACEPY